MTSVVDDLRTGLSHGRGSAFVALCQRPDHDLLSALIIENPCFDANCEDRSRYQAALVVRTSMDVTTLAPALEASTSASRAHNILRVLGLIAAQDPDEESSSAAASVLLDYVATGRFWELALSVLWANEVPGLMAEVAEVVATRLEEESQCPPLVKHPGRPASVVSRSSDDELRALWAQAPQEVLPLAREWLHGGGPSKQRFAREYLAAHGTREDAAVLLEMLSSSLESTDVPWCEVDSLLERLAPLGEDTCSALALSAWSMSPYSHARASALHLISGLEPSRAAELAREGIHDANEAVRMLSVKNYPQEHLEELIEIEVDPFQYPRVRALVRQRLSAVKPESRA